MLCNWITLILGALVLYLLISLLLKQLRKTKENLDGSDPVLRGLKQKLSPIHPIVEKLSFFKGNESYTINKEDVFLCLKDEKGDYYNENMLTYVALHEIAHAICDEVGHTQKFHDIFEDLLDKAYHLGLYNPSIPIIQDYCNYNKNSQDN